MTNARMLIGLFEGGSVHAIDRDGRYFLEINETACFDMLDEADRDGLEPFKTIEFSNTAERMTYIKSRGWDRKRGQAAFDDLGSI